MASAGITWRLASSFPRALDTLWGLSQGFAERVEAVTSNRLAVHPSPAGEPVAALDVLGAVAEGRIQCGHTAGSFFLDRDPVLALQTFVPFGLDWRRQRAWLAGPGRSHVEAAWRRAGVVAIPCGDTGAQMGGWFREPIAAPGDFRGLRIRTAGLPALVLTRLGAQVRQLPAADILPALQAGELDAADWIGPHDDLRMGFHRCAPVYHHPGVLEPCAQLSLIANAQAWEDLDGDLRVACRLAAADAGLELLARYDALNPPALAALEAQGVRLVRFPERVITALAEATRAVLDDLASCDPHFAAALRSYRNFAAAGRHWARLGEGDAAARALDADGA